jgi:SAM-dependent methyltransferase
MENWQSIYKKKQQLNKYPFSEVVSFCMKNFSGNKHDNLFALDVGAGSGVHSNFLADLGFNVVGIDGSAEAVKHAKKLFPRDTVRYVRCSFDEFDGFNINYSFVLDRLSTTHSSLDTTAKFYANLKNYLLPGAKVFWQGLAWSNSARKLGVRRKNGSYDSFSGGILKNISPAVFYLQTDIEKIFTDYSITNLRLHEDKNMITGYNHSLWTLEAEYI